MFGRVDTFAGIIISLSLGGVIFLSTTYTAESTKKNNNHAFRADEVSYMLGEVFLENGIFKWKEFYPEISGGGQKQKQRIIDNYNGIIVQQGSYSYRLKVNVYGYSDGQGNADGVDIKPGDKITLKVPETMNNPELLRFEGTDGKYIEDSSLVAGKIHTAINGLGRCMVKEYCNEINRRNSELKQKVWFFYGIAFVLFCISILHIANSMKYII